MDSLYTLKHEHDLIRQALDNITLAKEDMENGKQPPVEFFKKSLDFFRTLVIQQHHIKEEHLMFGLLGQKRNRSIDYHIEVINHQHNHGRAMIYELAQALEECSEGDNYPTEKLMEYTSNYASLLRKQLQTEDYIVYPMAEKELTDEEMKSFEKVFQREEAKNAGKYMEIGCKLVNEMGLILIADK